MKKTYPTYSFEIFSTALQSKINKLIEVCDPDKIRTFMQAMRDQKALAELVLMDSFTKEEEELTKLLTCLRMRGETFFFENNIYEAFTINPN